MESGATGRARFRLSFARNLCPMLLLCLALAPAHASTEVGPWTPIFKGIDHVVGTNTPGSGGFPELQVMHAVRVDLTDSDVQLLATPAITNPVANSRETGGLTVSEFLQTNHVQAAINANFFSPADYYLPAGTPMDVDGLLISQGTLVSAQDGPADAATLLFGTNNQASIVFTNWPPTNTAGIFTAVSGTYPLLVNGVNVGSNYFGNGAFIHQLNPRTAFGLSADRRYLFLLTVDGRQPGYSDGAYDYETAAWLQQLGAADAVNMDGGGSTTLVMQSSTGDAIELNHSSAVADSTNERTVGAHLGVYAKPVPGFINDIVVLPDDTSATISWTTIAPAVGQVLYDVAPDFANATPLETTPATNHSAVLTGLLPATSSYFRVVASAGAAQYVSPDLRFTTPNHVVATQLFDVTQAWKYTTADLDGVNWTARQYDDSAWSGPGAGLLWARGTPDTTVSPRNTQMPLDPNNAGHPYVTYYFRTHFNISNLVAGQALVFSSYVDDGAVFYLNGVEIQRVRMEAAPTPILNKTLALTTPCSGNATCPDDFVISGNLITNLLAGDNVLAVEAHNYQTGSSDVTFGTILVETEPAKVDRPQLNLTATNGNFALTWSAAGFTLQQAGAPQGPWADVPGPVTGGSYSTSSSPGTRFFRLLKR